MKAALRQEGKPAIELIEEAFSVLRVTPSAVWALYFSGSLPFVFGFLLFWGDMSRSAFAAQRLPGAALAMALLYCWMKFCHGLFSAGLSSVISAEPPKPISWRSSMNLLFTQGTLHTLSLFVLPLALLIVLPFGYVYAFFQNLTALSSAHPANLRTIVGAAASHAVLWPRQNHILVLVLALFSAFVFLNWAAACFLLPQLAKSFFGLESVFTRGGTAILNTTFFTVVLGLTFLSVSPLAKAVFALRCFYGLALDSGADLNRELRKLAPPLLVLLILCCAAKPLQAQQFQHKPSSAPQSEAALFQPTLVNPQALNTSLDEVLSSRKYAWRLPRQKAQDEEANGGLIARFFGSIREWWISTLDWLQEWFRKWFKQHRSATNPEGSWTASAHLILYTLGAVVVLALALLLLKTWRNTTPVQPVHPQPSAPDLTDENLGAEQLPEDSWIALALELLQNGEPRLALRALYLSSLAHLAAGRWLSLARFKSNQDYELELKRRGHLPPSLLHAFAQNRAVFDQVWYGCRPVDQELIAAFRENLEKIKSG